MFREVAPILSASLFFATSTGFAQNGLTIYQNVPTITVKPEVADHATTPQTVPSSTKAPGPLASTDIALQLLEETLKCPIPPDEHEVGADDSVQRVISELHFTGNSQRLSGFRIDTVRTYNKTANRVDVSLVRVDVSANFADIERVAIADDRSIILACAPNTNCFHVTETPPEEMQKWPFIGQILCNSETAENAKAAIEVLVRANGGHLTR
jgi:hypothetical protein